MNSTENKIIWMNGEFVPWEDAKVHVLTHALHYGSAVFEGVRAYETNEGPAIFRHKEHLDRLARSASAYYMDLPYSLDQLKTAVHELINRNGFQACYIRPLVYRGYGEMGLYPLNSPVDVMIAVWPWETIFGHQGRQNGIRAKVSSWRRIGPDVLIPHSKATGHYLNGILGKVESTKAGYDEAILLDGQANVCEATGQNIFIISEGVLHTPVLATGALPGITRDSIIAIARDLGYEVIERQITRSELYYADEVFLTGTASEIVPVNEIDDQPIGAGNPGEITSRLADYFHDTVLGRNKQYRSWLDFVSVSSKIS